MVRKIHKLSSKFYPEPIRGFYAPYTSHFLFYAEQLLISIFYKKSVSFLAPVVSFLLLHLRF